MNHSSPERLKMLVQAAKPTLFSTTARPELIISILYSNLMSERLWQLGKQTAKQATPLLTEAERFKLLTKIHKTIKYRFYHAKPIEVARIWGLHERERITDPADLTANDYAMQLLETCYNSPNETRTGVPLMLEFLEMGAFPEFCYPTVDLILAHHTLLQDLPSRPHGMTSCLDECILIAAVALVLRFCRLDEIVFIGSPFHYSLLLFPEGSDGYWFNAKRELFDAASWRTALGEEHTPEVIRDAFFSRMLGFDRLITANGCCIFPRNESNLSHADLESLCGKISRFLGVELKELLPATEETGTLSYTSCTSPVLPDIAGCESGAEFAERLLTLIKTNSDHILSSSLYTFRRLDVPEPQTYVSAALSGYRVWLRSAEVTSMEDALALVRAIPGRDSVFGPSDRLALPDEVLIFNTGNDIERILLLYTLLMLSASFTTSEKADFVIVQHNGPWTVKCFGTELVGSDL